MKQSVFTQFILYRYRYGIGYGLFLIALVALLYVVGAFTPGMLTNAEMQSAVVSANIQFNTLSIIDLPYHLLQKVSIDVLGLTPFAIKLPSLLLAAATGIGLLFLLRRWFKQNVAVLASIIAVTAGQFLILAQNGTSMIMLLFWPTILLLLATTVSAKPEYTFGRKLCFFVAAALSLYTPLSIYALIAMLCAALFHPHLRYMLLHLTRWKVALSAVAGIVILLPLIWYGAQSPSQLTTILGIPQDISWASIIGNLQQLLSVFFGFASPGIHGTVLTPMYGFGTMSLIVLGLLRLAVDHHSARTYTIGLWLVILSVFLVLQPSFIAITFVPLLLMLAIGIDTLFREWYGLFPRNPYARAAALIPLVILISSIVFTGLDRYMNSYNYHPAIAKDFTNDLQLLREQLTADQKQVLLTSPEEKSFYALLSRSYPLLTVVSDGKKITTAKQVIATVAADRASFAEKPPQRIITNHFTQNNLRFYIYKTE